MPIECPKCGHTRQPADIAPENECPACGVIYEKAKRVTHSTDSDAIEPNGTNQMNEKPRPLPQKRVRLFGTCVIGIVMLSLLGALYFKNKELPLLDGVVYCINRAQQEVTFKNVRVHLYERTAENEEELKSRFEVVKGSLVGEIDHVLDQTDRFLEAHRKGDHYAMKSLSRGLREDKTDKALRKIQALNRLSPPNTAFQSTYTNREGRFAFTSVPPGEYYVYVVAEYFDRILVWIVPFSTSEVQHLVLNNSTVLTID